MSHDMDFLVIQALRTARHSAVMAILADREGTDESIRLAGSANEAARSARIRLVDSIEQVNGERDELVTALLSVGIERHDDPTRGGWWVVAEPYPIRVPTLVEALRRLLSLPVEQ